MIGLAFSWRRARRRWQLSFRREYRVPKGGPDGGDGGQGGDVVLVADPDLRDLSAYQRRRRYRAAAASRPRGNKSGAAGETVELRVPVGTQVFDDEGTILADLAGPRRARVVAGGGAGGRGNKRFASPTRRRRGSPRRASPARNARSSCGSS